jgi:hypothetical protein
MAKVLFADVTKEFSEATTFATEGKGRSLFVAVPDDALLSVKVSQLLVTKGYKFAVSIVTITEAAAEPEEAIPDTWELEDGTFVIFKINPRRSKKGKGKDGKVKKFTKSTGWLEFSKLERVAVKAEGTTDFGDISKVVGARWNGLGDEGQKIWVDRAKVVTAEREAAAAAEAEAPVDAAEEAKPAGKKITGWVLFGKETRPIVKAEMPEIDFGGMAKELGKRWKLLGESGQSIWKTKATQLTQ